MTPAEVEAAFEVAVADYAVEVAGETADVFEVERLGGYGRAVAACPDRPSGVVQAWLVFDERSWRVLGAGGMIAPDQLGVPAAVVTAQAVT